MKIMFVVFLVVLLIISGFIMSTGYDEYELSQGEQLVNSISAKTAKIIKEKYNIKPCGMGVAMPGGPIQELTLCFDTKFPYSKETLRGLLIESAQELLNQINENKDIQQFIKELPFTIKNIGIIIYNNDEDGRDVYDPEISIARIFQGNLIYRTTDENDHFRFKNEFEETYEDALKSIKK